MLGELYPGCLQFKIPLPEIGERILEKLKDCVAYHPDIPEGLLGPGHKSLSIELLPKKSDFKSVEELMEDIDPVDKVLKDVERSIQGLYIDYADAIVRFSLLGHYLDRKYFLNIYKEGVQKENKLLGKLDKGYFKFQKTSIPELAGEIEEDLQDVVNYRRIVPMEEIGSRVTLVSYTLITFPSHPHLMSITREEVDKKIHHLYDNHMKLLHSQQ